MSTRETAYSIFCQLSDEQLEGFIAMFGKFYPTQENHTEQKIAAFNELEKMIRAVPDLDYDRELKEWREEKFGV